MNLTTHVIILDLELERAQLVTSLDPASLWTNIHPDKDPEKTTQNTETKDKYLKIKK